MRIFIRAIALMAAALTLSACSVGDVRYSGESASRANLHFVGVPTLLSVTGSSTPYTEHLSLTAAHVARIMPQMDVVAYHPYCDIALIRERNTPQNIKPVGKASVGAVVELSGYSARTILPVGGKGVIKRYTRYKPDHDSRACMVYTTSAGGMQGMSGGPAISNGQLVGIVIAINVNTDETIFIPITFIQQWLDEVSK